MGHWGMNDPARAHLATERVRLYTQKLVVAQRLQTHACAFKTAISGEHLARDVAGLWQG